MPQYEYDLILIGGGLHHSLLYLAARTYLPHLKVALLEQNKDLLQNHTWCCHKDELPPRMASLLSSSWQAIWPSYDIHLPQKSYVIKRDYRVLDPKKLASLIRSQTSPHCPLLLGQKATIETPHRVSWGELKLEGKTLLHSPGPSSIKTFEGGMQVFFGKEYFGDHGLNTPIVMDAKVVQEGGFRFFYLLPFSKDHLLIEETRFTKQKSLNPLHLESGVDHYRANRFPMPLSEIRREWGSLPMPTSFDLEPSPIPLTGYGGGNFHPTTGYSLPMALEFADQWITMHSSSRGSRQRGIKKSFPKRQKPYLFFNRLMFQGFSPVETHYVFQFFYGLPLKLQRDFFTMTLSPRQILQFFLRRPPKKFQWARFLRLRAEESLEDVIEVHSKSFAKAAKLLPRRLRYDVKILYAWCRYCDDTIDLPTKPLDESLRQLENEWQLIYSSPSPWEPPLIKEMRGVVSKYHLPFDYGAELLLGMAFDTGPVAIQDMEEFYQYCYRVAGVVGLMMCHMMGVRREEALEGAAKLGIAMQITNICRDVKEDRERGRCYIPKSLFPHENSPPLSAVQTLLTMAERLYQEATLAIKDLPPDCQAAIHTALEVYRQIGVKIQKGRVNPLTRRSATSRFYKIMILLKHQIRYGWSRTSRQPFTPKSPLPKLPLKRLGLPKLPASHASHQPNRPI